ncbi:MAG: NfeD family protein [Burkholderiaceae bacterium]
MWIWFGLSALALIGEVMTGTFYLLLVAVGLAAGGLAAMVDVGFQWQLVIAGLAALAGLPILRATGVLKKREVNSARNADVNLDIGQIVQVQAWSQDHTARVSYRGANWQAVLATGQPCLTGPHEIVEIHGSQLTVAPTRRISE